MRRLSVLHLITRLERGGSSDCTLWQAIGAARRGHRVTVASGPTGAPAPLLERARREAGLTFLELPDLGRPLRPLRDLRATAKILRLMRSGRYDVIHLHTSKAGALGRIAALLAGCTRQVIHQPHGHLFYGYYGRFGTWLLLQAERRLAPMARQVVTLTRAGAREHLERGVGRPEQYRTVPSGIDFRPLRAASRHRSACRQRLGYGGDDVVVGTLCRLEPIKGAEEVVRGFCAAADGRRQLRLIVGGDGPLRSRIEAIARDARMADRVRIDGGWTTPEAILPACDIFVLASHNEGMGRALVEAMALGVAVIGTSVGGVPELLANGDAGLLIPPGQPAAVAGAIATLADDPERRRELGRRGRSRAVAYGAGRMVRSMLHLYDEVAA